MLAHEIGHAIGMKHDFGSDGRNDIRYDKHGKPCTNKDGVMDYGDKALLNKFTSCSKQDFASWHRKVVNAFGAFCL